MDVLSGLTLAAPAGLNAYIPLLAVALAERLGWLQLTSPWDVLGAWWAIVLIAVLLIVEIVADKVPAVDHVNDLIQTVVRPAAGGLLAVSASGQADASSVVLLVAGVLIAGGVHSVKATARPVINLTTGGSGAPVVSTIEDVLAVAMTALALLVPVLALVATIALVVATLLMVRRWRRRRAKPSPAVAVRRRL
jgi:uncharacterized membrane protein